MVYASQVATTQFHLKTYSGESLSLLGGIRVAVKYQTQEMQLPLVVAQGKKPVLLGRNCLEKLNLDWSNIFKVSHVPAVENILVKYEALFEKGYGHFKLYKASIQVREGAQTPISESKTRSICSQRKGGAGASETGG